MINTTASDLPTSPYYSVRADGSYNFVPDFETGDYAIETACDPYITNPAGKKITLSTKRKLRDVLTGAAILSLITGSGWAWVVSSFWPLAVAVPPSGVATVFALRAWARMAAIKGKNENTEHMPPAVWRVLVDRHKEGDTHTAKDSLRGALIQFPISAIISQWCLSHNHPLIGHFLQFWVALAGVCFLFLMGYFPYLSYQLAKLRAAEGHDPFVTDKAGNRSYRSANEFWRMVGGITIGAAGLVVGLTGLAAGNVRGQALPEQVTDIAELGGGLLLLTGIVLWWASNNTLRKIERDDAYQRMDAEGIVRRGGQVANPSSQQPQGHVYDEGTI